MTPKNLDRIYHNPIPNSNKMNNMNNINLFASLNLNSFSHMGNLNLPIINENSNPSQDMNKIVLDDVNKLYKYY